MCQCDKLTIVHAKPRTNSPFIGYRSSRCLENLVLSKMKQGNIKIRQTKAAGCDKELSFIRYTEELRHVFLEGWRNAVITSVEM